MLKDVKKQLHELFKGGHPDYIDDTLEELDLYSRKNTDYTKGGDPFGNFKRVSAILALYPNLKLSNPVVICIVYLLKQLDAVLNMISNDYEGVVEGKQERFRDIGVYTKIAKILDRLMGQELKNK